MKKFIAFALAASPLMAFAQPITDINTVALKATNIGNLIVGLAISFSILWIIISVVRYLIAGEDAEQRKEGGYRILWGVVGLFVILSIWGLVAILRNSFVTNNSRPDDAIRTNTSLLPVRYDTTINGGSGSNFAPSSGSGDPSLNAGTDVPAAW